LLNDLRNELELSMIFISHDVAVMEIIADKFLRLKSPLPPFLSLLPADARSLATS